MKGDETGESSSAFALCPPPSPPACAPPLSGAQVHIRALAECPTPARARAQMRRYPEFGIRVLVSARVAATGVHTTEGGPGRRGGDKRHIGGIFLRHGRRVVCPVLTSRASSPKRRSASRTACLTQAGGARGRREWAARAGGVGGRRKRAARAGGARGWREVMVCRLRADGAVLFGGRGWPPVRREYVDGHRAFPKGGPPGVVGAVLPKDLPAFVDDPRGGVPLLVYPRSWAVFPAGRLPCAYVTRVVTKTAQCQ